MAETGAHSSGKLYLGIDPGRLKCGLALVDGAGRALALEICPIEELIETAERLLAGREDVEIALGDGTGRREAKAVLSRAFPDLALCLVDERGSSEEARKLYFRENPPRGILRLVPRGLLPTGKMIDAYAAQIIVFRRLEAIKKDLNGV